MQKHGGNLIPSFGGYGRGHWRHRDRRLLHGINAIAADYESVITTYHVTRLDMDVESSSLTPVLPTGLTASGVAVLKNAIATGTRIDVLNIMTFD